MAKLTLSAVRDPESSILITHDEILRRKIDQFISSHQHLPDKRYQSEISPLLSEVECTDTGNAIRMNARYRGMFRYVTKWKKWLVWNGRVWLEDERHLVEEYAKKVAAYISLEADLVPLPIDDKGNVLICPEIGLLDTATPEQREILNKFALREKHVEAIKKWGLTSRSVRYLASIVTSLMSEPGVATLPDEMDTHDHLLNCPNGTLNFRTGEFLPHNRDHLITRITRTNYNSDALPLRWDLFIKKITLQNPSLARFLQQIAGEGLCGEKLDDLMPVFHGLGGNGKTVFCEVLREVLGSYAASANTDLFLEKKSDGINNDIARLTGVRFLVASETRDGRHLDESLVKSLTGGDTIPARFLFSEFFDMKPKFTPVLLTNHKPTIKGTDNGIWRRVKLIPWQYDFEKDPDQKTKPQVYAEFREEHEAILAWCVEGYFDRVKHGLCVPNIVNQATTDYRESSDIIGAFVADYCITGSDEWITKNNLYIAYTKAMEEAGHNAFAKPKFGEKLKERGFEDDKSGPRGHFWIGIRLREAHEPLPERERSPSPEELLLKQMRDLLDVFPSDKVALKIKGRSYMALEAVTLLEKLMDRSPVDAMRVIEGTIPYWKSSIEMK